MSDVTRILSRIQKGDMGATDELLPLVYDELRKLAAYRVRQQKPGGSLQATELVHEAYLRLVDVEEAREWNSRGHFFAAAGEAMRRIVVDRARYNARQKRGNQARHVELDEKLIAAEAKSRRMLAMNDALDELQLHDQQAATLVKLRFFVGMQHQEAAEALGIGRRKADRLWVIAKTWLYKQLDADQK